MTQRIDRTTQRVGDRYHVWHTPRLWEQTKDYPVVEVEIASLKHLDVVCWFRDSHPATLRNVAAHFARMQEADERIPILLDPNGQIFDGAHRVAKAMAAGKTTIRAVQLRRVPPPDEVVDSID